MEVPLHSYGNKRGRYRSLMPAPSLLFDRIPELSKGLPYFTWGNTYPPTCVLAPTYFMLFRRATLVGTTFNHLAAVCTTTVSSAAARLRRLNRFGVRCRSRVWVAGLCRLRIRRLCGFRIARLNRSRVRSGRCCPQSCCGRCS